jgi:hypothetical protein
MDHRLKEIKGAKGSIEKEIRNEYAAVMERLKSAEGVKLALLQHDIAEIQKDISRIDEILMTMEEIATGENSHPLIQQDLAAGMPPVVTPDKLGFLHKYQ